MDSTAATEPSAREIANIVRAALAQRYARPIVSEQADSTVAVVGGKALELAKSALPAEHQARVVAIDVAQLPWHDVPTGGVTLWRQHGSAGADGEVVTQLEPGDPPVQIVLRDDAWILVRAADGAQGWVRFEDAEFFQEVVAPPSDIGDASRVDLEAFVAEVERFDGVPYVWGGTTMGGVDCSGLVQRAAWKSSACWLPRHSRALLGAGTRVAPSNIARGDVLILQRIQPDDDHPMHVAIALSATETLHASRDAMCVVHESLESVRERYKILGVRRYGPEGARA